MRPESGAGLFASAHAMEIEGREGVDERGKGKQSITDYDDHIMAACYLGYVLLVLFVLLFHVLLLFLCVCSDSCLGCMLST